MTFTADDVELRSDVTVAVFGGSNLGEKILQKIQKNAERTKSAGDCNAHEALEPDADEEEKQIRLYKTQTDEDNEEVVTEETGEEATEQHVDLESSTNEGPKEIFTSAEKGEENISDDEKRSCH